MVPLLWAWDKSEHQGRVRCSREQLKKHNQEVARDKIIFPGNSPGTYFLQLVPPLTFSPVLKVVPPVGGSDYQHVNLWGTLQIKNPTVCVHACLCVCASLHACVCALACTCVYVPCMCLWTCSCIFRKGSVLSYNHPSPIQPKLRNFAPCYSWLPSFAIPNEVACDSHRCFKCRSLGVPIWES